MKMLKNDDFWSPLFNMKIEEKTKIANRPETSGIDRNRSGVIVPDDSRSIPIVSGPFPKIFNLFGNNSQ